MQEKKSIIIRSKADPKQQMQLVIDMKDATVGVVMNCGLELLVIETTVLDDVELRIKEAPLVNQG